MQYTVVWTNVLDVVHKNVFNDYIDARMYADQSSWVRKAWIFHAGNIIYCIDREVAYNEASKVVQ